jgi:hypothetical protein
LKKCKRIFPLFGKNITAGIPVFSAVGVSGLNGTEISLFTGLHAVAHARSFARHSYSASRTRQAFSQLLPSLTFDQP